jgi:hypothetical protein
MREPLIPSERDQRVPRVTQCSDIAVGLPISVHKPAGFLSWNVIECQVLPALACLTPRCNTKKDAANFMNINNTLRHNNDFVKKILKGYCVSMLRTRYKAEYM